MDAAMELGHLAKPENGEEARSDTQEKLAVRKVRFAIANAKSRLYDMLAATNLLKRILANDPTISVEEAVTMMRDLPPLADKSSAAASGTSTASNPV
ncbi:hypothetical protein PHYSODRAFT_327529 [Phytophthora sojae]|uniref:Uncharacterized protein n=1 Tax=Phytophthora sojae (strain P6497) TaxID=1094619 RepID=G4Z285_PHYSP|nr:hypothetical protein PHYSODRAFT_327529 [Phytophthora sojae]EGZ19229.1 hypothetical protein PHYSODRAFT_327529 [Phytophthora sojae]|eukprot:XP_009521946.1 hypothetical protein PHYSODRAFT_327529 [Phytophthora sojae]